MPKRIFDLVFSALALLLLAPMFALVALAIRWDTPGPVFFRQDRVGRLGRPFRIRKFRTMVVDAPSQGPALTIGQDPRITRVGVWLRRTKLDELPQLIDVLQGHMSLVGPRPEVPQYVALYPPELRERVLAVRPGITDPVSLKLADEARVLAASSDPERTYREDLLPAKLREAVAYAEQASLWSDLRIIWATARVLWLRRGPAQSPRAGGGSR
ncbi:MAG: sugar transferase [Betaproteobacteria bacterium]|jgi:lipopolysaccharide/colanic/teichoic acid biosynthesis glycosyltransferase